MNVPEYGVALFLRTVGSDRTVAEEIFGTNHYELFHEIKVGDVVVDAGANIGCFSVKACKKVGEHGRVFAIEPSSSNFDLLRKSVAQNGFEQVCTMFHLALGKSKDIKSLKVYGREWSDTLLDVKKSNSPIRTERVRVERLDDILPPNLSRLDLVKIDVEGSELELLAGARETLNRFHPDVVVESHSFGPASEEIAFFLSSECGYRSETVASGGDVYVYGTRDVSLTPPV